MKKAVKKKHKGLSFFFRLTIVLVALATVVFGVYFSLDKLVVPKYFKAYGIHNMHDLVAMVKTLYNSPDEDEIVTNGYLSSDLISATKKFKDANFPMNEKGEIDYTVITEGFDREELVSGEYEFTDREITAVIDQMLESESGVLASKLPNIKYIDFININLLEIIISPEVLSDDGEGNVVYSEDSAKISFTSKIDTSAVRKQMAKAMDTPLFLLNMIVPETLYVSGDYNMFKTEDGSWDISEGYIRMNGRSKKDSQILLDLLVDFIFPEEDKMTVDKLSDEFGNIIILGLDVFGDVRVKANINESKTNGIIFTL